MGKSPDDGNDQVEKDERPKGTFPKGFAAHFLFGHLLFLLLKKPHDQVVPRRKFLRVDFMLDAPMITIPSGLPKERNDLLTRVTNGPLGG